LEGDWNVLYANLADDDDSTVVDVGFWGTDFRFLWVFCDDSNTFG